MLHKCEASLFVVSFLQRCAGGLSGGQPTQMHGGLTELDLSALRGRLAQGAESQLLGAQFSTWYLCHFDRCVSLGCLDKIPLIGWLKQQKFISHSSAGWRPEIGVPARLHPGESLLLAWRRPPYVLTVCSHGHSLIHTGEENELPLSLLIRP